MRTPTTSAAPLTSHRAAVDLCLDSGGGLRVVWHDAPNMAERVVSHAHVRRILATMDAVHDAEQTQDASWLHMAWLAASHEAVRRVSTAS